MMHRDPYKREREAEYASYNKAVIRILPLSIAFYILILAEEHFIPNKLKAGLIILGFHVVIEIIYLLINKDTYLYSTAVFLAWVWSIYVWLFLENGNAYLAFGPSIAFLFIVARLLAWYGLYKSAKENI